MSLMNERANKRMSAYLMIITKLIVELLLPIMLMMFLY